MGKQIAEDGNAAVGSQGHQRQGEVIIAGIDIHDTLTDSCQMCDLADIAAGFLDTYDEKSGKTE